MTRPLKGQAMEVDIRSVANGVSFGAATIADGADVTLGAKADSAATTDTGTFSLIALTKRLLSKITTQLPAALGQTTMSASLPVTLASDQSVIPTRPDRGTYVERSTTITSGGTAQEAMAANTSRKAFFLQNISSGDLWFSFVETAAVDGAGSVKLPPGASVSSVGGFLSTQALSIIGATTGQKFTLWEG